MLIDEALWAYGMGIKCLWATWKKTHELTGDTLQIQYNINTNTISQRKHSKYKVIKKA